LTYFIIKALHYEKYDASKHNENFAKDFIDKLKIEKELLPKLQTKTGKCIALS